MKCTKKWEERKSKVNGNGKSTANKKPSVSQVLLVWLHGRTELDTAGFICAEEDDKQTNIKKFVENFTFFCKNQAYYICNTKQAQLRARLCICPAYTV